MASHCTPKREHFTILTKNTPIILDPSKITHKSILSILNVTEKLNQYNIKEFMFDLQADRVHFAYWPANLLVPRKTNG